MSKFVKKVSIFIIIISLLISSYCLIAKKATDKFLGPDTASQIRVSFKNAIAEDYNCYFLGNSRIYRNINPDEFPTVNAYNFGFDNDSYNQMYYKLLYLLDNKKNVKYLIIGTDYFQFSHLTADKNYVYSDLFPSQYMDDFAFSNSSFELLTTKIVTFWKNKQTARPYTLKYLLGKSPSDRIRELRSNGQYVVYGNAKGDEYIGRIYDILDVQYDYYQKIITLCEKEKIELFVVMPPLWEAETHSRTNEERDIFDDMILNSLNNTPYEGHYINYTIENGLSSFEIFTDSSHLTPEASDDYSRYLNQKIFIHNDY